MCLRVAGKSTTLSMLTGLLDATSGSAFLCGFDINANRDSVFSILGICPQFDTVWDDLTGQCRQTQRGTGTISHSAFARCSRFACEDCAPTPKARCGSD
jgi:ABC-type uncharacterized transport system ATPase subunit